MNEIDFTTSLDVERTARILYRVKTPNCRMSDRELWETLEQGPECWEDYIGYMVLFGTDQPLAGIERVIGRITYWPVTQGTLVQIESGETEEYNDDEFVNGDLDSEAREWFDEYCKKAKSQFAKLGYLIEAALPGGATMKTDTYICRGTPDQFEISLKDYADLVWLKRFRTDNGYLVLQHLDANGPLSWVLRGSDFDKQLKPIQTELRPVITFTVFHSGDAQHSQLRIQSTCAGKSPDLVEYYCKLLDEIKRDFPTVGAQSAPVATSPELEQKRIRRPRDDAKDRVALILAAVESDPSLAEATAIRRYGGNSQTVKKYRNDSEVLGMVTLYKQKPEDLSKAKADAVNRKRRRAKTKNT